MTNVYLLQAIILFSIDVVLNISSAQTCHYQDWRWNVNQKRVVQKTQITKDYSMLTAHERDAQSGCSVCLEDQQPVRISGLPEFLVCKKYADQLQTALTRLINSGAHIKTVTGYRVGRTRGDIDTQGNRTEFSNHSYGVAIDINADHNGLYIHCLIFGPQCQLSRGGPWRPGIDPYSLEQNGTIVTLMKTAGFKWGGEIWGQQKDFMHFSLTGY